MEYGKGTMEAVVNPSPEFWEGKRVLVTGHTGFKGSWLILWLSHLGARVSGLALDPPSGPNLFDLACGQSLEHHSVTDIRYLEPVIDAVAEVKPEIVIHMAAQALVRTSYEDPVTTFATNIMGTVHMFEAVRRANGVEAVVNVTSDKCYDNREWFWAYREDEPMGGHDPYSCSKGCAELITSAFRRSFFEPDQNAPALASARAGNVIGGGDWAQDRLVPDCIRSFSADQPVEVRSPNATRPWQHVLEPLSGYLILAERLCGGGDYAQAWNFGPAEEDAKSVSHVVERLSALWGGGASWHISSDPQPHESTYLKVDPSKARVHLGWTSRLKVDQALAWTAEWYKRQLAGENARELCLKQIRQYEAMGGTS